MTMYVYWAMLSEDGDRVWAELDSHYYSKEQIEQLMSGIKANR